VLSSPRENGFLQGLMEGSGRRGPVCLQLEGQIRLEEILISLWVKLVTDGSILSTSEFKYFLEFSLALIS